MAERIVRTASSGVTGRTSCCRRPWKRAGSRRRSRPAVSAHQELVRHENGQQPKEDQQHRHLPLGRRAAACTADAAGLAAVQFFRLRGLPRAGLAQRNDIVLSSGRFGSLAIVFFRKSNSRQQLGRSRALFQSGAIVKHRRICRTGRRCCKAAAFEKRCSLLGFQRIEFLCSRRRRSIDFDDKFENRGRT